MAQTYEPIATTTLGSDTSEILFSSIPATYTDLILIADCQTTSGNTLTLRFNSDSATNYSQTYVLGNGTAASSAASTSITSIYLGDIANTRMVYAINIMSYANTSVYKTVLARQNYTAGSVSARVGTWRSTAAINSVRLAPFTAVNLLTGSTATLYGIKAA